MLSNDEKEYLFSKLETTKKRKCIESENDVYQLLKTDKKVTTEDFIKILKSLEYSFRKKLKEGDISNVSHNSKKIFKSIQDKLPEEWMGVNYSSLSGASKRKDKKPTIKSKKSDIIDYLKKNNIKYNEDDSKEKLVNLFESNILSFD